MIVGTELQIPFRKKMENKHLVSEVLHNKPTSAITFYVRARFQTPSRIMSPGVGTSTVIVSTLLLLPLLLLKNIVLNIHGGYQKCIRNIAR